MTMAEYAIARVKAQLDGVTGERELKPREQFLLQLLTPIVKEYEFTRAESRPAAGAAPSPPKRLYW